MLEFTKSDLARLDTTMKALKRGKYELEGEEVLAFAQAFAYVSDLFDRIKADIENPVTPPIEMTYETKPEKKAKK